MKAKTFILINEVIKINACLYIKDILADGKTKVTICNAGDKSVRQRGLQWRWNTDVALSGKGGEFEDTKENVHLVSKYRWAIPILIRDDDFFSELYSMWIKEHKKDPEKMKWFVDTQVHTEMFNTSQMAEFLTEYQKYYISVGIELSNPDDQKLLYYKRHHVKD